MQKLLRILLLSLMTLGCAALGAAQPDVVPARRMLTVVLDDSYPPFAMRDASGALQGLLVDRWRLWQQQTGLTVELRGMDWARAQEAMRDGQADVIDTMSHTPAREVVYDFGTPYADVPVNLYFRADLAGVVDAASSREFQVGVKEGDRCVQALKDAGSLRQVRYTSYEALATAAFLQEVPVFCMAQQPADYLLAQAGVRDQFRHTAPLFVGQLGWAVRKGDADTRRLVADGFAHIDPEALKALEIKWFGAPLEGQPSPWLRYTAYLLLALGAVLLVLVVWLTTLRQLVRRKTQALEDERARFETLFQTLPDPVWLKDPSGVLLACNAAYQTLMDAPQDQLLGKTDAQSLGSSPSPVWASTDLQAIERGESVQFDEWVSLPALPKPRLFQTIKTPMRDAQGRLLGVLGVARDITAQHESEERFRRLFEDTRQPITLIDDGRFVAANRASLAMMRLDRLEDLLGRSPIDISPERQPDGRSSADKAAALIAEAFAQGGNEFEWEHIRADGEHFIAHVLLTPIRQGERDLLHVVWSDITQQKEAERERDESRQQLEQRVRERTAELALANEEQQAVFNAATVGIVLTRERVIRRCNRTMEQLFGYAPGELTDSEMARLYPDRQAYAEAGERIMQSIEAQGYYREEGLMRRKDGSLFWCRKMGQPLDRQDLSKGMAGTFQDISAEREVLAEMARARALAEEAARVKADFLANMSHEIRTPMNSVIGMTHLALRADPPAKVRDYLQKIQSSSRHLLGVINDILDFSKLEANKMALEHVEFDLEKLLDDIAAVFAEKFAAKGLELVIGMAPEVPHSLVGDPLRIEQVLINYVNNALKFTEHGSVTIRAELHERRGDELLLRFTVRDTGIGIEAAQREQLFRSFQQADTSTTRKYGGTGLGLAISKHLAELMGGSVGVDSTPAVGSTFWFTARVGLGSDTGPRYQIHPDLRGLRMLVVDDNEQASQVVTEMLRGMGFEATAVHSAAHALDELARADAAGQAYDLVLLDWRMPEMDGVMAARAIQRQGLAKAPVVLMITAYDRDEVLPAAEQVGVREVLVKPVSPSALFDAVMRQLGGPARSAPRSAAEHSDLLPPTQALLGARALLVEDNVLNQEVATEFLHALGLEVDLAENGAVALEKLQHARFDVVLMDMQMPVMDGLTATREIRKIEALASLPILAMTANAMAVDRERCLEAGMNDHIAKPIDPQVLVDKLLHWVRPDATAPAVAPQVAATAPQAPIDLQGIDGLDARLGLALAMGREPLYRKLLDKFVDSQRDTVARIDAQIADAHWPDAAREAHTLKGVAAQIGARPLRALAERLEQALQRQDEAAARVLLHDELAPVLTRLLRALEGQQAGPAEPAQAQPAVDLARWQALRSELLELLRNDYAESVQLFQDHEALARAALGERFGAVQRALEAYDFATALQQLEQAP